MKDTIYGFQFNNVHSDTLGIIVNNEYNSIHLSPHVEDHVLSNMRTDGAMFYNSKFKTQEFTVSFVFQDLQDEQIHKLRQLANDKYYHKLIFDEYPYKVYTARVKGISLLKHIAFSNDQRTRLYNGEGSLIFETQPYAQSKYEYIEDYLGQYSQLVYNTPLAGPGNLYTYESVFSQFLSPEEYALLEDCEQIPMVNHGDLLPLSRNDDIISLLHPSLIPSHGEYGRFNKQTKECLIFNAGDIDMPFKIIFDIHTNHSFSDKQTIILSNNMHTLSLTFKIKRKNNYVYDRYLLIDMGQQIIQGLDENFEPTGNLYNDCITEGNFFFIPLGKSTLSSTGSNFEPRELSFKYLYL